MRYKTLREDHGMKKFSARSICYIAAAAALVFAAAGCGNKEIEPYDYTVEPTQVTAISVFGAESVKYEDPTWNTGCQTVEPEDPDKFKKEGNINGLDYKIISATGTDAPNGRGYYLFGTSEGERPYIIVVDMGEKRTGGYDIEITGLKFDGSTLTVTVKETSPALTDTVTQALTYPCCAVEFSKLPDNIKVIEESGYEYKHLGTRLDIIEIKSNWIACFCNGSGEILYKTYVYKTSDGKYKYVNATATTVSWGSSKWKETGTGTGTVDTKNEIVEIAKKSGSCGYVMFPGENKPRSVSEFLADKK